MVLNSFQTALLKLSEFFTSDANVRFDKITLSNIFYFYKELGFTLHEVQPKTFTHKSSDSPMLIQYGDTEIFDYSVEDCLTKNSTNVETITRVWLCFPYPCSKISSLRVLVFLASNYKLDMFLLFILSMIIATQPLFVASLLSQIPHVQGLILYFFVAVCFLVIYSLLQYLIDIKLQRLSQSLTFTMLFSSFADYLAMSFPKLNKIKYDEALQSLNASEEKSIRLPERIMRICFEGFLLILMILTFIYANSRLALFIIFWTIFYTILKIICMRFKKQTHLQQRKINAMLTQLLNLIFANILSVQSFRLEAYFRNQWQKFARRAYWIQLKLYQFDNLSMHTDFVLPRVLWFACYLFLANHADTNLLLIFFLLSQYCSMLIKWTNTVAEIYLSNDKINMKELKLSNQNAFRWLPHLSEYELRFRDVSYQFDKSNNNLLRNVNLKITTGQFVGIIGASGIGKSTLMKLIMGIFTDYLGVISLNGVDIRQLHPACLHGVLSYLPQSAKLESGTIFSNIAAGTQLTLDEVRQICHCVGLTDDLKQLPMQLHTYVSDQICHGFSAGQQQKILLARSLAKNPKILLLDEATSALDNMSQRLIRDYLDDLKITRIVIAHRLSTLKNADVIYHLDKGLLKPI